LAARTWCSTPLRLHEHAGRHPPYLTPYFAAKAAMDSLAVSYAAELARFNIETTIVVPGSFTRGTNHFATGGQTPNPELTAVRQVLRRGLPEFWEGYPAQPL
jgi:NAD(P)-dependent dehydrogenase (short-subunit alcohol dehydrogenase family)